ncbi:MAG: hypothetical protein H5U10_00905 [Desulfacinum sp.]|nr:hypothetical protein [Desulfacinum sp.]
MDVLIDVLSSSLLTTMFISILLFLARNLFIERLKLLLQKEHSKFLDELQWNRKVQEQAARVAEYLALARRLRESSPESDYERANQLSWELAMWLPDEIYKQMTLAIVKPNKDVNELTVTISVRKLLLGEKAGNLTPDDIAHHAPGIGKKNR